jgi:hydroxymethylbilane synthase
MNAIRLGTRGSKLALAQSELVAERLRAAGHEVELLPIVTEGDVRPIDMSPGEGVFVATIARALLAGEIDIAVHSAKDVPLEEDPDLAIAAYPERADPRDALVTRGGGGSLVSLPHGAIVGTDSPRRTGFVLSVRPDLRVIPLHGNVETRLRRLDEGGADALFALFALILAAAGMDRLGKQARIDQRLEPDVVSPAPGQGALAVQVLRSNTRLMELVSTIDDGDIRLAVEAEREVLRVTGGTCRAPVGALASLSGDQLSLIAGGVNSDGSGKLVERMTGRRGDATDMASRLGRRLLAEVALR